MFSFNVYANEDKIESQEKIMDWIDSQLKWEHERPDIVYVGKTIMVHAFLNVSHNEFLQMVEDIGKKAALESLQNYINTQLGGLYLQADSTIYIDREIEDFELEITIVHAYLAHITTCVSEGKSYELEPEVFSKLIQQIPYTYYKTFYNDTEM